MCSAVQQFTLLTRADCFLRSKASLWILRGDALDGWQGDICVCACQPRRLGLFCPALQVARLQSVGSAAPTAHGCSLPSSSRFTLEAIRIRGNCDVVLSLLIQFFMQRTPVKFNLTALHCKWTNLCNTHSSYPNYYCLFMQFTFRFETNTYLQHSTQLWEKQRALIQLVSSDFSVNSAMFKFL